MSSQIVTENLEKDKHVLGKAWFSTYGNYFADEENIQIFISAVKPFLPNKELNILYVASASGLLGERLLSSLGKGKLTMVDISQKHLDENKNPETIKICADILEMDLHKQFDVIIMRSSLDYFPTREMQIQALSIIKKHLKPNGLFINQPAFIPQIKERNIISDAYNCTGKIGQRLFQSDDISEIYEEAGLKTPKRIGEGKILHITEQDHVKRYEIDKDDIKMMQDILRQASPHAAVTKDGYELRFEFPIFMSHL